MKIWGPPASKRSARVSESGDDAKHSDTLLEAPDKKLLCMPLQGNAGSVSGPGDSRYKCVSQNSGSCVDASLVGPTTKLSDGARRLIQRCARDPPVDVALESPPLRSAADVGAIFSEISRVGQGSVRTLTVGPWGGSALGHACGSGCDNNDEEPDDADTITSSVLRHVATWSLWHLRSFSVTDLRLGSETCLVRLLRSLPGTVNTIRLNGLGLGPSGWIEQCVSALRSTPRQVLLDLSRNGLQDKDVELLTPLISAADSMLTLTGLSLSCNLGVTHNGLTRLLSVSACSAPGSLITCDLSECSLGVEGADVLVDRLKSPVLASLQELSLYRVGFDAESICRLVEGALRAPALRTINMTANGQHTAGWVERIGRRLAASLHKTLCLRVLTVSCPELEMDAARRLFNDLSVPCRVILVPNEQNNYNRQLFHGDVH